MALAQRILVLGASSFSGYHLASRLAKDFRVIGTYHRNKVFAEEALVFPLRITPDYRWLSQIERFQPDSVFYCIGIRNEQLCAKNWSASAFVNAEAPYVIADKIGDWGGHLYYLSSTKVFSGEEGNYPENAEVFPQSYFGETVVKAEDMLQDLPNVTLLRIGKLFWLRSISMRSYFDDLLYALWAGKPKLYVGDEYRSFLSVDELALAAKLLVESQQNKGPRIYHLAHQGSVSYYSFAVRVAQAFGLGHEVVNAEPGESHKLNGFSRARRGVDRSLSAKAFETTYGMSLGSVEEALERLRNRLDYGHLTPSKFKKASDQRQASLIG